MKQSVTFSFLLVLTVMLVCFSITFASEEQSMMDPLLREVLNKQPNRHEMITSLSLRDLGITSLDGIETLINLRTLDLRGNPITNLEPLRNLIHLESLNLRETLVSDLSPLVNLVQLEYLNIHSTNVKTLEVIANFSNLRTLIMRDVFIGEQLDFLKNLTQLTRLNIRNTGVKDLTVIVDLIEQGALQNDLGKGVQAEIDIRDNPLSLDPNLDSYAILRPYWNNIAIREPAQLPDVPIQNIYINEIMSSNGSYVRDQDGEFPDWIELYNPSNNRIDISGYYLSDDLATPDLWQFPSGTFIPAKGYLLVYASGKDFTSVRGELHTNFKLSAIGEAVILSDPEGKIVDYLAPVEIPRDVSYGRFPDGGNELLFFTRPTPTRSNININSYSGVLEPPRFSHTAGFYQDDFSLELKHNDPKAIIYYTLDGSEPNSHSLVYKDPILITKDNQKQQLLADVPVLGQVDRRRVATDHVGQLLFKGYDQWQAEDIFQGAVIRAVAYKEGEIASRVETHTFFIDSNMETRYSFPIISLVTDPDNLMNNRTGIYVAGAVYRNTRPDRPWHNPANYNRRGIEWERPVSVEFFEVGGSLGFSQNMGMRIHGGVTRSFPQKSFKLYARSTYDSTNVINYPVFPDLTKNGDEQPLQEFHRLLFRNSGNDWVRTLFADALMQSLISHRKLDTMAYRPVIIFINGEYWGIINMRERYDQHYVATHYGVNPDDVVILDGRYHVLDKGVPGDEFHYANMLDFALTKDMTSQENYDYIQTLMDVDNFIDYYTAQIYYSNTDWPAGNIMFWRTRTTEYLPEAPYGQDGRWRWMLFDTDFGFGYAHGEEAYRHNSLQHALDNHGHLLRALLPNEDFRNQFLNTFADHLNTSFKPERVVIQIDQMEKVLLPEITEHIDRWGQPATSIEEWQVNVDTFREFALKRPSAIRDILVKHFQLKGAYQLTVNNLNQGGLVTVNSIAISPDTPGVTNTKEWKGEYFLEIPLQVSAKPLPGYRFLGWGGDITSTNPTIEIKPDRDLTLTAIFEKL